MHLKFPSCIHAVRILVMALSACQFAGCAGIGAGILIDAAVPAIDKTSAIINAGKCEAYEPMPMTQVVPIVRQAAEKLNLAPVSQTRCDDKLKLVYQDMRRQKIEILIVPRTKTVTAVLVDVGWFGEAGMGRLTLRQILHDMPGRLQTDVDRAPRQDARSTTPVQSTLGH